MVGGANVGDVGWEVGISSYFPLDPGCLIGILIMVYCSSRHSNFGPGLGLLVLGRIHPSLIHTLNFMGCLEFRNPPMIVQIPGCQVSIR